MVRPDPWSNGPVWLWVTKWSDEALREVLDRFVVLLYKEKKKKKKE